MRSELRKKYIYMFIYTYLFIQGVLINISQLDEVIPKEVK